MKFKGATRMNGPVNIGQNFVLKYWIYEREEEEKKRVTELFDDNYYYVCTLNSIFHRKAFPLSLNLCHV